MVANAEEVKTKANVLARFGETATKDGERNLCIYSKEELTGVEYRAEGSTEWVSVPVGKAEGYFGFMSSQYLPTNDQKKYFVRGVRKDGTRFTNLLTVKSDEKDLTIAVEGHLEEARPKEPEGYPGSLALAQGNIGRRVGNGGCNDLGTGGGQIGSVAAGGTVTGQIVPGAILEMRNFSISSPGGVTWSSPKGLHYAVIESFDPASNSITILHQNTAGGNAAGQSVRRDTLSLSTLKRGSLIIRTGSK